MHQVVELGVGEIDRVAGLFKGLVSFHRQVVERAWPVRGEEEAWAFRRRVYERWLSEGTARMLAAVPEAEPEGTAAGYAVFSIGPGGASWDFGERIGELETLAVAEPARGQGVGTMLIEACAERLRAEGITHWAVGVVEANTDATRLYERAGFRPYYRTLIADL